MDSGRSLRSLGAALIAAAVALAGCGTSTGNASGAMTDRPPAPRVAADDLTGTLTVFAAASLTTSFDELRTTFRKQHPKVDFPAITYDGSSTLVEQLKGGAPADIFASADETNMDKVADLVTGRVDFATNSLQIAVAPGNPKGIHGLADLARAGIVTILCAPDVPCGAASHRALAAARVRVAPASEEQNVKAVLTKVASGDADAGLVYTTDVTSSGGDVDGIDFPEAAQAINTYPIARLSDSPDAATAEAFLELVTSAAGQRILASAGFGKP